MPANYILGMNAKAYVASALFSAANEAAVTGATLTELTNCKDVSLNLERGESDITTRANNGWRATAATLKDGTVTFQMQWKPDDANFEAIKTAYFADAEIACVFLDQAYTTVGAQGLAANFTITNFTRNEALEEAIMVDVTLKPSSYTQWFEKTGS